MQQSQGTVGTCIYQAVRLGKQIGIVRARAAGQAAQAEQQEEVMRQFHVGVSLFESKDTIFSCPTGHTGCRVSRRSFTTKSLDCCSPFGRAGYNRKTVSLVNGLAICLIPSSVPTYYLDVASLCAKPLPGD